LRFQVLQCASQLVPGAMDVGLYCAERQVEGGCDLFVRTPLDVTQQYAGSILGSKLTDSLLDGRAELLRLELFQGRLLWDGNLEGRRFDGIGRRGVWRAVHADGIELPTSQMIDRDVVGDLEKPTREL